MKRKTKEKLSAIGKYAGMWVATLVVGLLCWACTYVYLLIGLNVPKALFPLGLFTGITGTAAYFMAFSLLTPVAKWIWGKIKHNPKSFIKLIK